MTGLPANDDTLVEQIKVELKKRNTFDCALLESDAEQIARIRSLGRRAGRELGWKVRTAVGPPSDHDGPLVAVLVMVTESNPLHHELTMMRARKKIREAMNSGDW